MMIRDRQPSSLLAASDTRPTRGARRVRLLIGCANAYRRGLAALLGALGPRLAYAAFAFLGRRLYRLLDPIRQRSETQCTAALGKRCTPVEIPRIAEQAFVHRAWNLADLMLAERLLHRGTYERFGGRIPEPHRTVLLDAVARRQPVILVTAYYGPYDLLPLLLGFNGIPATAVYRAHANADFDAYRRHVRARGGCTLVRDTEALTALPRTLAAGGTVAILSDHEAGPHGIALDFLGVPTRVSRAVALLAVQYNAAVAVAGIRRRSQPFRFDLVVSDLFGPDAWQAADNPQQTITARYVAALERIILADPAQYLWAHARWGADLGQPHAAEVIPADASA